MRSRAAKDKANGAEKWAAEMVAALYDESLDAFAGHNWMTRFNVFRQDYSQMRTVFANQPRSFQQFINSWGRGYDHVEITYRSFPPNLTANLWRYAYFGGGGGGGARGLTPLSAAPASPRMLADAAPGAMAAEGVMLTKSFSGVEDQAARREMAKDKAGVGWGEE